MSKIDLKKVKKAYGIDLQKEVEGVWFNSSVIEGLRLKIAKTGNPVHEKLSMQYYKPYMKQIRKNIDLPKSVRDEISTKLIIESLLMDWEGMPGVDGENVPFSKEEARGLIEDPALKEFKSEIMEFADDNASYSLQIDEEIEGN